MRTETYLQFWGKALGGRPGEPLWHPVAYHNLDVAAVADVLLRSNPRRLSAMARLLGASDDATRVFLVAMIALHDIGKFSSAFQAKVPEFYPGCLTPWTQDTTVRHDLLGSELRERVWSGFGSKITGWSKSARFHQIWHSVSGHHGKPMIGSAQELPKGMRSANFAALDAFVADVLALFFSAPTPLAQPDQATAARLSWAVAGLTVLADWIGSNRDWFKHCEPTASLAAYWPLALAKAETAVAQAGILHAPLASTASPAHLLPERIAKALSPLQVFADSAALPDGPVLAIIEDVTGSGKTEAALLLAARLMQENRASGIFFALPTMATANAMYERLGDMYRKLFAEDAKPSLVLAHGRQALHSKFQGTILISTTAADQVNLAEAGELSGNESGAACAAWIADSRRKAFLAHIGVGTIDQALLAVLPSKFQALRLWGLADRVLIIDEAHAYDAYMGKEIETVLEFQAALGGSAIILSATLPEAQRRTLVAAYSRGLGQRTSLPQTSDYPLVTLVGGSGADARRVDTREDRKRRLSVRRISSIDGAVAHVAAMASNGAAVAWIRNSVDDAIEAVQMLERHGLKPVLLHARFAMGDRLDIERLVTETLGRPGAKRQGERPGFVLVGTQILEQSLDYDVDAMIVDLAPVDLMVQRAGRLWRHAERDSNRPVASPELLVHAPDPALVTEPSWYGQISKRAGFVYRHHGIVWRSASVLFKTGHITTPEGVRDLIEQVYGPLELDDIPALLHKKSQAAIGEAGASLHCAKMNVLKFGAGYDGADNESNWQPDTVTPTRLGLPVTIFRLGVVRNGRIEPLCWSEDKDLRLSWALSEVSIAQTKIDAEPVAPPERARLIEAAKASWPPWERDGQPLLVLEPDGTDGGWRSAALKTGKGEKPVLYDKRLGFRVTE